MSSGYQELQKMSRWMVGVLQTSVTSYSPECREGITSIVEVIHHEYHNAQER